MSNESMMPPVAEDPEKSVLGSMLIDFKDAGYLALDILAADDFYTPVHREIFSAISEMSEQEKPIDMLTVGQFLKEKSSTDFHAEREVSEMTRFSTPHVEYNAMVVKEYSLRRRFIQHQTANVRKGYDLQEDIFELIDQAQQQLMDSTANLLRHDGRPLADSLPDIVQSLKEREETYGLTGVPSKLPELDDLTGGWQDSDLIILAARPSMGKTAAALKFAMEAAEAGKIPGIISLEMSERQLVERLLSTETQIPNTILKRGGLYDAQKQQLDAAEKKLKGLKMMINDDAGLSIMQVRSLARRWKREHGIGLLIIDYLQLLAGKQRGYGGPQNREQEIAQISRELKKLGKELDIPIVALSQLSRAVENRPNKRPQLSDLRESGSLEQDSDVVIFLYRPEYYNITQDDEGNATEGVVYFLLAKQRNGPTGEARSHFDKRCGRFGAAPAPEPPPSPDHFEDLYDEL